MIVSLNNYSRRHQLQPLCELNPIDLDYLFDNVIVEELQPRTLITLERETILYLLEGQVSILSGGFVAEKFNHGDKRALLPLFDETIGEDSAITTSHGTLLKIDRELFDGLYSQHQTSPIEPTEALLENDESALFSHLLQVFEKKQLPLPTLADAALKIRQTINSAEIGSTEIIGIIQTDPILSTRLIKVANSPLYATWRRTKTVGDAVRRLGLENTRRLVFSLSMKQLFSAKTAMIKDELKRIYEESIGVSALASVITRYRVEHLDPEQAMMAGLIQNLGVIPILKYIDENPHLVNMIEILNKSLLNLRIPISSILLEQWHFGAEFLEVIEQSENWNRDTGKSIDYADIVIASRLIFLNNKGRLDKSIHLQDIPVMKKLNLIEINNDGYSFFEQAQYEIDDIERLLKI